MNEDKSNVYVGFGVAVDITDKGPKTTITIANKQYPAEKINELLDSIEPQIQDIKSKMTEIEEKQREEIKQLFKVYDQTNNPVDKLRLIHRLVEIAVNISTIATHIIDIKSKLGM